MFSVLSRVPPTSWCLRGWSASKNLYILTLTDRRHSGGGGWCSRLVCTQTWVSLPVAWLSCLRTSDNTLRALCKEDLHTAANNSDASCVSHQEVRCHRPSRWIRAKAGLGSNDPEEQDPGWDGLTDNAASHFPLTFLSVVCTKATWLKSMYKPAK